MRKILIWLGIFLLQCAPALADDGRWWRGESDHFIVYGDRSEQQVRNIALSLEDFDATLRALTGGRAGAATSKLDVFVLRARDDLREVAPGILDGVAGLYSASQELTAVFFLDNNLTGVGRNVLLQHEYAHHFMLEYFPFAYPSWYVEGWAEYVSTIEFRGRRATVGIPSEGRGGWVVFGSWLPIEVLLEPDREPRRSDEFYAQFYAQAWFAALYVANRPERMRGLDAYVRALGEGADPIEAFEPAFGVSPDAFDRELRNFTRENVSLLAVTLPEDAHAVEVTRLPSVFDELLLPMARARRGVSEEQAASFASELEVRAQALGGHPAAQLALARAAILRDELGRARPLLQQILAADPRQIEADYLMAEVVLEEARSLEDEELVGAAISEARRRLVRIFRQDPTHVPTLFLYSQIMAAGPSPMTTEQLQVLVRALELAPQAPEIRLLLAEEYMQAELFENAVATLRPILFSPHNAPVQQRARTLFDAALRREASPAPSP